MATLISVLIFIVCILLILVVLVQNSKGGGLSSQFQGQNQVMGVRKTADFLEKATWTLAIALLVLSLGSAAVGTDKGAVAQEESQIKDLVNREQPITPPAGFNGPIPTDGNTAVPLETPAEPQQ